ncbi:hypothetical protein PPL_09569 [Heterostelium album PN500]|uniref:Uncharacterized protein n=1 Tax=Heterostelium pallidum (strain ATCC 26659 / Pp 5 / PN500) TaxID=670386 RepID=D3BNF7_HETP5|nr:hypothetical protein PPL_09569 [Heterostelium album PN500]EFA76817.1 hypothetical protein PPL_09569 [Heterostelium album PN500]|eukprot:XP_020428949.1 hypothetical protein PPL_09569 [Heterostelium album PN500]
MLSQHTDQEATLFNTSNNSTEQLNLIIILIVPTNQWPQLIELYKVLFMDISAHMKNFNQRVYAHKTLSNITKLNTIFSGLLDEIKKEKSILQIQKIRKKAKNVQIFDNLTSPDDIRSQLDIVHPTENIWIFARESSGTGIQSYQTLLAHINYLLASTIKLTDNNSANNLPTSTLMIEDYQLHWIIEIISTYWYPIAFRQQMEIMIAELEFRDLVIISGLDRLSRHYHEIHYLFNHFESLGIILYIEKLSNRRVQGGSFIIDFGLQRVFEMKPTGQENDKGLPTYGFQENILFNDFLEDIRDTADLYYQFSNAHGVYSKRDHTMHHWKSTVHPNYNMMQFISESFGTINNVVCFSRTSPPYDDRVKGESINCQVSIGQSCFPDAPHSCVCFCQSANPLRPSNQETIEQLEEVIDEEDDTQEVPPQTNYQLNGRSRPTNVVCRNANNDTIIMKSLTKFSKYFASLDDDDTNQPIILQDFNDDIKEEEVEEEEIDTNNNNNQGTGRRKLKNWILVATGMDRMIRDERLIPDCSASECHPNGLYSLQCTCKEGIAEQSCIEQTLLSADEYDESDVHDDQEDDGIGMETDSSNEDQEEDGIGMETDISNEDQEDDNDMDVDEYDAHDDQEENQVQENAIISKSSIIIQLKQLYGIEINNWITAGNVAPAMNLIGNLLGWRVLQRIQALHRIERFDPTKEYDDDFAAPNPDEISMSEPARRLPPQSKNCVICTKKLVYMSSCPSKKWGDYCSAECALEAGEDPESDLFKSERCIHQEGNMKCNSLILEYSDSTSRCIMHVAEYRMRRLRRSTLNNTNKE